MKKIYLPDKTLVTTTDNFLICNQYSIGNSILSIISDDPNVPLCIYYSDKSVKELNKEEEAKIYDCCIERSLTFFHAFARQAWGPLFTDDGHLITVKAPKSGTPRFLIVDVPKYSGTSGIYPNAYIAE